VTDKNPYSTPHAALDDGPQAAYHPRIFAVSGRIGRLRYMAYGFGVGIMLIFAVTFLAIMAGGLVGGLIGNPDRGDATAVGLGVTLLASAVYVAITIVYGKRRFNDLDRSGWWSLLLLVPYLQLLPLVYLVFFPGTDGPNRFGPPPRKNSIGILVLGWSVPLLIIVGIGAAILIPAFA